MVNKLVVYTVVLGTAHELPPRYKKADVDWICFTDQDSIDSKGWTMVKIEPYFPFDLERSSREPKTRAHLWLKDYERSIYVDSKVQLKCNPEDLWKALIPTDETAVGAIEHSFRESVAQEIEGIYSLGLDHWYPLENFRRVMAEISPEYLNSRPIWGGIIARRHHHPTVSEAMDLWFSMILHFSKRDQLYFPYVLSRIGAKSVSISQIDNRSSKFHVWPWTQGHSKHARPAPRVGLTMPSPTGVLETREGLLELENRELVTTINDLQNRLARLETSRLWRLSRFPRKLLDKLSRRKNESVS